jgi:alpha-L-rhamnosidase
MNSFNHYSYGAIGDWMYRVVTGIDTYEDAPGYKHIKIQPHLSDNLTYADATLKTYYGNIRSHWKRDNGKLEMDVEVPANTRATVYIPAGSVDSIKEGEAALNSVKDVKVVGKEDDYVAVEIGSGKYHFVSEVKKLNHEH